MYVFSHRSSRFASQFSVVCNDQAKYAYRSIAQFVKHVTTNSAEHVARNPFPELHRPTDEDLTDDEVYYRRKHKVAGVTVKTGQRKEEELEEADREELNLYKRNEEILTQEVREDDIDTMPGKEVMKRAGEEQRGDGEVSELDETRMNETQFDRETEKDDVESIHANGHTVPESDKDNTIYARATMVFSSISFCVSQLTNASFFHVKRMNPKISLTSL